MIYLWLQLTPLLAGYRPNSTDNLFEVLEEAEEMPLTHIYARCIEKTPIDITRFSSESEKDELEEVKYDCSMLNIDDNTSTIVFDDYPDSEMIYKQFNLFTTNNVNLIPLEVNKEQSDDTKITTVLFDNPKCFLTFVIIVAVMFILGIVPLVYQMYWLMILASFLCVTGVLIWFITMIYSPISKEGKVQPVWY